MLDIFTNIYRTNFWRDRESVSGPGSNLKATEVLRDDLPGFLARHDFSSLLDIPCGDYVWQAHMKWPAQLEIIAADIVPEIVENLDEMYADGDWRVLDATTDKLPKVDVILVRDLLVHFSDADIKKALKNFRASGSKYLLSTTFPGAKWQDIQTGEWHIVDLAQFRYGLGKPIELLAEHSSKDFSNKSLGLWRLN